MAKPSKRTKLALWLLIAPTALIIVAILFYILANLILTATGVIGSNSLTVSINITLYFLILIGSLAWLPGLITGIVLLATPKK